MKKKKEHINQIYANTLKFLIRIAEDAIILHLMVKDLQELIQSLVSNNKNNAPPYYT
ncbi:hypothetical protein LCGC14_0578710 [marine sediment metagenome]|uniref:Uncharacterized protein n=1 Tax=marine sediment metagenome TaxID=412755 RepID=A0A0F9U3F3_9ZZZZ